MPPAFSWFLAYRYLLTRWVNLIGMIGIGLAVWAMIVVVAVFSGFIGDTERGIREASPDLLLTELAIGSDFGTLGPLLEPHVEALAPRLSHDAILLPIGGRKFAHRPDAIASGAAAASNNYVLLIGIDPEAEQRVTDLRTWLSGRPEGERRGRIDPSGYTVENLDDPFEISPRRIRMAQIQTSFRQENDALLGPEEGILLGMNRLTIGDTILPGQRVDIISARFERSAAGPEAGFELRKMKINTRLAGAFTTDHRFFDLGTGIIDIDTLRSAMGEDELSDRQLVTEIAVKLKPGADFAATIETIRGILAAHGGGKVLDWTAQNKTYIGAVNRERTLMKIVLFAVLVVACFLIFATLHMMVVQKTKDIGILTSMGATPGGIGAIFVLSSVIIGGTGCLVGAGAGVATAVYLNKICELLNMPLFPPQLYAINEVPINLEVGWIAQVIGGALLLSLLVAWLPARRAARLDPVKALMHE